MFSMQNSAKSHLDAALGREDIEDSKELIRKNFELKDYINKKLYALVKANDTFFHAPLTPAVLQQAQILLSVGADPNYYPDTASSITLLDKAVAVGSLDFVSMLLENGANTFRTPIESLSNLSSTEDENFLSYSRRMLSVQRAYEKFMANCFDQINNKIFDLISKKILEEHGKELEDHFKSVFLEVIELVKAAKALAKTENKRLMILIGEDHEGLNSCLIESMVYLAANAIGVNTVLTEQDEKMLDFFNKTGKRFTRANQWGAIIDFLKVVKDHDGKIVPIDIEQTKLLDEGVVGKSAEDVVLRDNMMARCANQVKTDVVCVVGGGHLYGLLNKTDLTSNFHVLSISTTIADFKQIQELTATENKTTLEAFDRESHQVKSHEFSSKFPDKVKNLTAFESAEYQTLVSPNESLKMVYRLFEELKPRLGVIKQKNSP